MRNGGNVTNHTMILRARKQALNMGLCTNFIFQVADVTVTVDLTTIADITVTVDLTTSLILLLLLT